ncbi:MAG: DUF2273 domain-containing protein [Peptococcaceae bacterium]|nr:DUF2273 domain-containing protein [Peptococcaceae bacterium]
MYSLGEWCLQNHPGKFCGSLLGFVIALTIILLGFWQTIFIIVLTSCGFYLGRCWDQGMLPSCLNRLLHRIRNKDKK